MFADLKTMDAGELEAGEAFKAGADLVTVLGVAGDSTIAGAVKAAKEHGKGIVVDLIGVHDKAARAKEVVALGAEFVEMHAGLDEQAEDGFTFEALLEAGKASACRSRSPAASRPPRSARCRTRAPRSPSRAPRSTAPTTSRTPHARSAPRSSSAPPTAAEARCGAVPRRATCRVRVNGAEGGVVRDPSSSQFAGPRVRDAGAIS